MPPLLTNLAIPVISRSPDSKTPSGSLTWKDLHKGRTYDDGPLPIRPSKEAPRNARIISRDLITDDRGRERVTYKVAIGDVEMDDIGIFEVLDYVSPDHLEQFENEQFEQEREAMRIAKIAEEEEEERRRLQRKARAKTKGTVLFQDRDQMVSSESEEEMATGKHGRARPTYTHMFEKARQRKRRRRRDPATGELMPLSDEEEVFIAPKPPPAFVRPPAPDFAEIPKRRRRKRDPVTGELLPLDPLPESVLQPAQSSPAAQLQAQGSSQAPLQSLGSEKKRPRRRRHPLTGELMPLGWRYDPEAEKGSYERRRDGSGSVKASSNVGSPSMNRLSISEEGHASKRVKLGSESSWDGLPVEETLRSPAKPMMSRQSSGSRKPSLEPIEISDSEESVQESRKQNLLASFKEQKSPPKTSMMKPMLPAKDIPRAATTTSSAASSREPLTLKTLLQPGDADSSDEESSSDAITSPAKKAVMSPNTLRKTSIMNPIAPANEPADEEDEDEWFVEAILGHRMSDPKTHPGKPQTMLYKVKWEGYDEPTWEPEESFADPETVQLYRRHAGLDKAGNKSGSAGQVKKAAAPNKLNKSVTSNQPTQKPISASKLRSTSNSRSAKDESDSDEDEDDDGYVVENILAHHMSDPRTHPGKPTTMLYKVKWVGWDDPTWEPAASFDDPKILNEYKRRVGLK